MPWIYLLLAGLFEIGFALGMKYSEGFSKPLPTAATVVSALISLYLMSQAMKSIPVGTAYAIWTGIGAMGVAVLGIYLFNDSASPVRPSRVNRRRCDRPPRAPPAGRTWPRPVDRG
ncbi:DMT family transporter [Stenotrophomonas maltophilia]|uniref:DMT family transporter n=2 Tax=Stenotrophomonas maltophilia group TaxID=995085 RepID=UPI0028116A4F|nr:multidrug efflux SMR transporter [Stenotrophomonas maltophilia]WMR44085.1 multidrug efflux SMR transporter [Stenotrophomonas maltophilia]